MVSPAFIGCQGEREWILRAEHPGTAPRTETGGVSAGQENILATISTLHQELSRGKTYSRGGFSPNSG